MIRKEVWMIPDQDVNTMSNDKLIPSMMLLNEKTDVDGESIIKGGLVANGNKQNNDRLELARLREKMGLSLKPIVGMPDGYYTLDLSRKKDRACFSSLIEQSEYMKLLRIRESYEGKVDLTPLSLSSSTHSSLGRDW